MTHPASSATQPQTTRDYGSSSAELYELIQQRLEVLRTISEQTSEQLTLVEQNRMSALLELLNKKQHSIAQLSALERALAPHRNEDPESRSWPDPQQRRRCQQAQAESQTLLAQILEIEQRCEAELAGRRDSIGDQLDQSHSAAEACRAYGQNQ